MKNKKVATVVVWSIILLFAVVIAVNWYAVANEETVSVEEYLDEAEEEAVEVITVQNEKSEEEEVDEEREVSGTEEMIASAHDELNRLVGWNRYRGFSWKQNESALTSLVSQLEKMVEMETNDKRRKDAENTIAALNQALDSRDTQGIILAHRIMHDLDYYVNGNDGDGKRYNVTEYR
ncbi:hypothetical protein N0O92_01405 [Alkalihalobacillus sp. MEB130]|uniref:hypothetical protein n=1 Tax=Alkalihalobacillus sp. MEB130 TaxID=2976704 RepID=UPI0028DDF15C|nr:hypothetical protein [Alkalihalobacillus sp. MEB130]MDT8858867.1 hypothetical protein [Alkalihalobacillus sp. MEB130]